MPNNFLKYGLCVLISVYILSCKKKKETVGSDPPAIEMESVTPANAVEFKDSIAIIIKYTDVNGDLGDTDPDTLSLVVKDSRLAKSDAYHIQPLAPMIGKNISISGQLRIKLNSLFLLGGGTTEQTVLTIKLKDRAGNWSNEVSTPKITITK